MSSVPAPTDLDDSGFDLVAIIRLLWSYRLLIGAAVAVCVIIAVILALTEQSIYRAESTVVEVRDDGFGSMGDIASQLGGLAGIAGLAGFGDRNDSRNSLPTLKSRQLAEEFIIRYKLLAEMSRGSNKQPTMWKAVERFRKSVVSIREDKRTGLITVGVEWTDPAVATRWANDFVALANERIRSRTIVDSTRNIKYLNEQIAKTGVLEMQRVMYNLIESETKTLMLANGRVEYAFKVIDRAVEPEMRISPKRTVMVIIGGLLGGILGLMLVFAHRLWKRLRSAEA